MTATSTSSPFNKRPAATSAEGRPRRRRGLLDGLLMLVLVYAVYAKTPLGAIGETAVNVARGQKDRPSWLATFAGRETNVSASPEDASKNASAAEGALPPPIVAAAEAHKVDAEAVAALVITHGACTATGCTMEAPPRASAVLGKLAGKTQLDADDAAALLAAGQKDLELNPELAVEAMWLGPIPVKLAVEQARRSNSADAADVEQHADFLSPSARRGPLQGALAVLAVYRLRTLSWPTDQHFRITSGFGDRIHPVTGAKDFHSGVDIGVPMGTPLWASAKGRVKRQSQDSISGNYVILDLGLGILTTYCHMTEAQVREGDRVKKKDVVGISGATGRVTGPHLHYMLRVHDKLVDASKYGGSPVRNAAAAVDVPPEKEPPPTGKAPPNGKPPKPPPNGKAPSNGTPSNAKSPDVKAPPNGTAPSTTTGGNAKSKTPIAAPDAGTSPPTTTAPATTPSTTAPATTPSTTAPADDGFHESKSAVKNAADAVKDAGP